MTRGPIDWEHPPSTRVRHADLGPRLLFDAVVIAVCAVIAAILLQALRGGDGVSARGVRAFFLDGLPGATTLAWGVIGAVGLAALYALVDAVRALRQRWRGARG